MKSWEDEESFLEEAICQYLDILLTQQKQIQVLNRKKSGHIFI